MSTESTFVFEEGTPTSVTSSAGEAQQASPPTLPEIKQVNAKLDLLLKALGVDTASQTGEENDADNQRIH